jgi:hypothetical protein
MKNSKIIYLREQSIEGIEAEESTLCSVTLWLCLGNCPHTSVQQSSTAAYVTSYSTIAQVYTVGRQANSLRLV